MLKRLFALQLVLLMAFSVGVHGDEEDTYNLKDGDAYMDKTFIYEVESSDGQTTALTICAEKDAPTYDGKKGLITWIDYKAYRPEEIFGESDGKQIRAILELAGPHKDSQLVVEDLKERTGIGALTYDEVVSAMQYAIWFYSDDDFRIPSTSNGEDLYKYFVTLPPEDETVSDSVLRVSDATIVEDKENNDVIIQFNYSSTGGSNLTHSYSKNLVTNYNAVETVTENNGVYYVTLTIPKFSQSMTIDFEVAVKGKIKESTETVVFAPDEKGSVQMVVGIASLKDTKSMKPKSLRIHYRSYRMILKDYDEQTITSHKDGDFVSLSEIQEINPTGREGYTFEGWFDENQLQVMEGILMDSDRVLTAQYDLIVVETPDLPDEETPQEELPNGVEPDEPSDEEDVVAYDPDDQDPNEGEGTLPDDSNPEDVPDDVVTIEDETLPADETPGWMPSTGGIPLLIFVTTGSVAIIIGLYIRKSQVA